MLKEFQYFWLIRQTPWKSIEKRKNAFKKVDPKKLKCFLSTYLSMQIFSTWGTNTCSNRIIVCNGNLARHDATHSGVGVQTGAIFTCELDVTRMLPRYKTSEKFN